MPVWLDAAAIYDSQQQQQNAYSPSRQPGVQPLEDEDEQEQDNPVDPEEEEAALAKPLSAPIRPTPEMIEQHNVSHLPFRAWCNFCVRGRGQSSPHRLVDKGDEQIPTIRSESVV